MKANWDNDWTMWNCKKKHKLDEYNYAMNSTQCVINKYVVTYFVEEEHAKICYVYIH